MGRNCAMARACAGAGGSHDAVRGLMDELTWELLTEVAGRMQADLLRSHLEGGRHTSRALPRIRGCECLSGHRGRPGAGAVVCAEDPARFGKTNPRRARGLSIGERNPMSPGASVGSVGCLVKAAYTVISVWMLSNVAGPMPATFITSSMRANGPFSVR